MINGFSAFTPTFKAVGVNAMSLNDVKIVDVDGQPAMSAMGMVFAQIMDEQGGYTDSFTYFGEELGWYGDVEVPTIKPGQSLCINNIAGDTLYLRFSGEVDLENKNEVPTGFYLWGNSTPVEIDLNEVTVVDIDGNPLDDTAGFIYFQLIDDEGTGAYLDSFTYFGSELGWFGSDIAPTLAPGECGCVNNIYTGTVYFKLPSPIK